MVERLDAGAVQAALHTLDGWALAQDGLQRDFEFADFRAAFAFMTAVAALAEAQDHHPDWHNRYRRVSIRLFTHEAGGITARDIRLASAINRLVTG